MIKIYSESADQLVGHLAAAGVTIVGAVTRRHVSDFITHLLTLRSPATASARFRGLRQFVPRGEPGRRQPVRRVDRC